tara:strand:+ start:7487 stop:8500 length:1014 start_codon:yes stop_codon:yes gene_type:complete
MQSVRNLIDRFDWSLTSIIKIAVAIAVVAVTLAIVVGVIGVATNKVFNLEKYKDSVMTERFVDRAQMAISEPPFVYGGGDDAEEYERRSYDVSYKTRKFEETCAAIEALKPLEYVVFDSANNSDKRCNYTFRVELAYEEEIVTSLQDMNPTDFREDSYTLERSIENSESELEMQRRRLASAQTTLAQAEVAFNTLIAQATREGDTGTLSEVINNKINTIDRLTQQILSTQERIDRLERGLGQQTDQIAYAHFNTSVERVVFVDTTYMGSLWQQNLTDLVDNANAVLIALTLGLLGFILEAVRLVVYATIVIIGAALLARALWVVVKKIWRWNPRKNT